MKNPVFLFLLALGLCVPAVGQDVKFGKIDRQELESTHYDGDSSAAAVVLHRSVQYRYAYRQGDGFQLMRDVHERIKIFDNSAYDYATVTETLYTSRNGQETISSMRGLTYNLTGGEVTEDKIRKSDILTESYNEYYNREKFTMPNVREGSVIEYEYTVTSPFAFSLDEIVLQYDIPIARQDIRIAIPEFYEFKPQVKGYLPLDPKYSRVQDKIDYTVTSTDRTNNGGNATMSRREYPYVTNVTEFNMNNVPALREEPFVNAMDNYRASVNYELLWVQYPGEARENYSTTWEKVIDRIQDSDRFGSQLRRSNYFKDALAGILKPEMSEAEKAAAVYRHVQNHMNWNGLAGYMTDKGVKTAYEEKAGNVADINLMLVSMLREAGLNANPVLLSTRDNGVPMFPTRDGFNYVIAQVQVGEGSVLLDASDKFTEPNIIPIRALNWFGRAIDPSGEHPGLNIIPSRPSEETTMINLEFSENGSFSGQLRNSIKDYRAYRYRQQFAGLSDDDYREAIQNRNEGMAVSELSRDHLKIGRPVQETLKFTIADAWSEAGDKIYFNPMSVWAERENPFKEEARKYPVDFAYPYQEKYMVNIALPEGYRVESLPESVAFSLDQDMGAFRYQIQSNGASLQLLVQVGMNHAVIPATYYAGLREFFETIVQKESEQVVLTKTTSDGTTGSATGGR